MATFTATRASATLPVAGHGFSGSKKTAYGSISISAAIAAADVFEMCRIPKGAIITGGWVRGGALNTADAVSSVDMDIGWASDPDALGNFGAWSQTAIVGLKPTAGYLMPLGGLLQSAGPQTVTAETTILLTCVASMTSGSLTTATISVEVNYLLP